MGDSQETPSFEATVRRAFERLTTEDLPRAAASRGWALRSPDEFEQLLLGHLGSDGRVDRTRCCLVDLVLAVELGGRLLAGTLCCDKMMDRLHGTCLPPASAPTPSSRHRH